MDNLDQKDFVSVDFFLKNILEIQMLLIKDSSSRNP